LTEDREITSSSFYKFLSEKKLMATKCKKCGALFVPPHPICGKCNVSDMDWVEMKGDGKLAAFSVIAVGPSFTLDEGYDRNNPYVVGVVQLNEGPKVSARIQGFDPKKPEGIKVGTPLSIEFHDPQEGKRCYISFKTK